MKKFFYKKWVAGACAAVMIFGQFSEMNHPVKAEEFVDESYTDTVYIPSALEQLESGQNQAVMLAAENLELDDAQIKKTADVLRDAMVERKTDGIAVTYQYAGTTKELTTNDNWKQISSAILNMAVSEEFSEGIYDGDYLRWSYSGCAITADFLGFSDKVTVKLTYQVGYYTTAEQEAELQTKLDTVIDGLKLDNATQYEKAKSINQYISDNVTYDKDNLNNDDYKLKHSAYAALIDETAVCQGYATLYHAMCKSAGMDSRVITGKGNGGAHAWNIIKIDGAYYNVDSTWFDNYEESGGTGRGAVWFAKNTADFGDHVRDAQYETAEFHAVHPMAETSIDAEKPPVSYDVAVFAQYKKNTDSTYTVRLISEVPVPEVTECKKLGFRFSKKSSGAGDNLLGTKIFKSVVANGETVTAKDGMYFVILEIQNVSADAVLYAHTVSDSDALGTLGDEVVVNMAQLVSET